MAEKSKSIIVNTPEVNRYGFRVISEGIVLKYFLKNPVMFYNHHRTWKGEKDEILPIGYWENLRIEDGNLVADPVFDEDDDYALQIKNKYDKGVLRAASINISPIITSDAAKDLVKGQKRATVMQSELREISIVDIPGNRGSVVLSHEDGKAIELSDGNDSPLPLIQKQNSTMDELKLFALALGLASDADAKDVLAGIQKLKLDKDEADAKVTQLRSDKETLEAAEKITLKLRNEQLVDTAIAAGKIKKTEKEVYLNLAEGSFDSVKSILDGMKAQKTLADQAGNNLPAGGGKSTTMSFEEMSKKNSKELLRIKREEPDTYKLMYKEQYGKDPVGLD